MRLLLLCLLILSGCAAAGGTYDPDTCEVGNRPGDCASDFTLLDGAERSWTFSEAAGKARVVSFGQMWCTQCRRTAEDLAELLPDYDAADLQVFAVYFEDPAGESVSTDEVADYADEYELPFPVLADQDGAVEEVWGYSNGRPNVFVVDRDGIITFRESGHDDDLAPAIAAALDDILAE